MSAFDTIAAGLEDAIGFTEESADRDAFNLHIPASIDVKAIRKRYRMSQEAFAAKYGFTRGRIRDWEQNRSTPDMPSRLLPKIIENGPEAVERAVAKG